MKILEHCGAKNENQKRKAKKTFLWIIREFWVPVESKTREA